MMQNVLQLMDDLKQKNFISDDINSYNFVYRIWRQWNILDFSKKYILKF